MIPIRFDEIDDPIFPMEDVACSDGVFTTSGFVELAKFRGQRRRGRYRILLRITDAVDYAWDPRDGDGSLVIESLSESQNEVRFVGVMPAELRVETVGSPRVEFLVDETPFELRRWFRWVPGAAGPTPEP
jgi:hypothetical protein